ncbi:MAG TPA: beta-L-arabinofuranosidase domain-containing protein [Streptosporangiaceae bacterium]|nr:beta-L-arabinofuranosidase domain-containing protein [Streptosporangiaceae bacterium]
MGSSHSAALRVTLADSFWAPRQDQLRTRTLPVLLSRLDAHGALDAFRRLAPGGPDAPRQGLWFTDSDVYKWMEAAAWAGRTDLLDPVISDVQAAVRPDGYLGTYYDAGAESPPRYQDLSVSHEWYCAGHFVEAALAHHTVTGTTAMLDIACRWADHLCDTFGPGRDQRTDGHPEAELALVRLAGRTSEERYLRQAKWIIEQRLSDSGLDLETVDLAGHAVRALYLASGIAEVANATGEHRWVAATERLFDTLVEERSYPTGAVGGRWLGEATGKPYELPDAMAYAESCAAVAAVQFCQRIWNLTADPRALDQIELALCNAVPCGTGAGGETWFYSQPQAVAEVAGETNPWAPLFDYGEQMLLTWFPVRRHEWYDVTCCPTNLARMSATVQQHVADLDPAGNLRIQLPFAAHIDGGGWRVRVGGGYPQDGAVTVQVQQAPRGGAVLVRIPGWAGGNGHVELPADGSFKLPVTDEWWQTDRRVEGAAHTVYLRRGPVVYCVEGSSTPELDLRDLVVDPSLPPQIAFGTVVPPHATPGSDPGAEPEMEQGTGHLPHRPLHRPAHGPQLVAPVRGITPVPYHSWGNNGPTTMRIRFPRALATRAIEPPRSGSVQNTDS